MSRIHSTAVIAGGAKIAEDVEIGAYCCVGEEVVIEAGVVLHSHVVVAGRTTHRCRHGAFIPSPRSASRRNMSASSASPRGLEIGRNNVIREYVTMNGGTDTGGVPTTGRQQRLFHGGRAHRP